MKSPFGIILFSSSRHLFQQIQEKVSCHPGAYMCLHVWTYPLEFPWINVLSLRERHFANKSLDTLMPLKMMPGKPWHNLVRGCKVPCVPLVFQSYPVRIGVKGTHKHISWGETPCLIGVSRWQQIRHVWYDWRMATGRLWDRLCIIIFYFYF